MFSKQGQIMGSSSLYLKLKLDSPLSKSKFKAIKKTGREKIGTLMKCTEHFEYKETKMVEILTRPRARTS